MSRKKSFIEKLTPEEKKGLEAGKKTGKSSSFRTRCHAILLSNKGYDIGQITDILEVHRSSVYTWFSTWQNQGIEGLKTKPGQGRKAVLHVDNKEHVKAVEKTVEKVAKKGGNLLAEVEKELSLEQGLSQKMLRTFLKKLISYGNDVEEA